VAITVVSLLARWVFAIGAALGDDDSYAGLAKVVLRGEYPALETVGITEYRPGWFLPIAASIWLLGWTARGLVLYPVITGGFIPLLTALWLRRHLPRESQAPVLCGIILACYPTLFVDSLMLVNDTALIFWCLLSVNFFGSACSRLLGPQPAAGPRWSWAGYALLAGAAFTAAYQVKISAIPTLGLWLATDLALQITLRGWPERTRWAAILGALGVFLLPALGVQLFYRAKNGQLFGNFAGEMRSYEILVPESYFRGQLRVDDVLWTYVEQLVFPVGQEGFRVLLHGAWIWVTPGLGLVAGVFWRRLRAPERTLAMAFLFCSIAVFLFLEFWPARLHPYYLPNVFNGRSWRYVDVLAPTLASCAAVLLTLPGVYDRAMLRFFRYALLSACFGIAGYSLVIRYHAFADSTEDYRHAAEASTASLASYFRLPQLLDPEGFEQFTQALGWPDTTPLRSVSTHSLDLRDSPPVCIWTGGSRRQGMNADGSWAPDHLEVLGGDAVLIHTFNGLRRSWRPRMLQVWLFRPNPMDSHALQPQP
jgi:hypothetical protein